MAILAALSGGNLNMPVDMQGNAMEVMSPFASAMAKARW
jgi:hypothetical protein